MASSLTGGPLPRVDFLLVTQPMLPVFVQFSGSLIASAPKGQTQMLKSIEIVNVFSKMYTSLAISPGSY